MAEPIKNAISSHGFNADMGFELIEWRPGFARAQVRVREGFLNTQGIVQGGIYCSFLDFTSGCCGVFPEAPDTPETCMTLSLSTSFLSPARSGTLYCTARRTGGGRSIFFAEAQVEDEAGTAIASSSGTFKYTRKRTG